MKTLESFFDYTSPYSYLASTQVEVIAERAGAQLAWRPFVLAFFARIPMKAVARGSFGAPTLFVGEEMFIGNDRLPFVERALTG